MKPNGPNCKGCPLQPIATGFVQLRGTMRNGILLVAEALGEEEAAGGDILIGGAGRVMRKIIHETTDPKTNQLLRMEDFSRANVICCRPPDNHLTKAPYEGEALRKCRPHLEDTLKKLKPKVIVTLGNQALRWFTGRWGIDKLRGYAFDTPYGTVVPTYHPSYIMRGKFHLSRVVRRDLLLALAISREGRDVYKKETHYNLHPTPVDMEEFLGAYKEALEIDPETPLAFDIETPYFGEDKDSDLNPHLEEDYSLEGDSSYNILRISFAYEPFKAISIPWCFPYIAYAVKLLGSAGPKLVWHGNFDVPRLEANDCPVKGDIYDAMHAWHYLEPSLPMGLKYAAPFACPDLPAWALQSSQLPEWYNAVDSDSLLRTFLWTKSELQKQGRWEVFHRHFVVLSRVLKRMTDVGVLVDKEKRVEADLKFQAMELQAVENAKNAHPREARVCEKKPLALSKERLQKQGLWREGFMKEVEVEVPLKTHALFATLDFPRPVKIDEYKASLGEDERWVEIFEPVLVRKNLHKLMLFTKDKTQVQYLVDEAKKVGVKTKVVAYKTPARKKEKKRT